MVEPFTQPPSGAHRRDYRDVVIETLADSEADLRARVNELEVERESYRLIAKVAIHELHRVTRERDQMRRQAIELRNAHRADQRDNLREAA